MSIDLERRSMYSCCSATPAVINITDIQQNGLINNSIIVSERQQMLDNKRVNSCESFCWEVEDKNLVSGRLLWGTNQKTYTNSVVSGLAAFNIVVGSRCNLTCSYCCKNYSRSWLSDIEKNGNYQLDIESDRYIQTPKDKILRLLPQEKLKNSDLRDELVKQIKNTKFNTIDITGGEPFLYEDTVLEIIDNFNSDTSINLFTGAGLPHEKFRSMIKNIAKFKNVSITISAENIGKYYEFNRYGLGHTYKNFLQNVNCIADNLHYKFASTFSNLTIFGFMEFVQHFGFDKIYNKTLCADPSFLHMRVLDNESKKHLLTLYENDPKFDFIVTNLNYGAEIDIKEKKNLSIFLKEFSQRRNLSLDIFPKSFLNWLYVV